MIAQDIFGISGTEFIVLAIFAILMFGPEKLPSLARKTARIITYLRNVANGAAEQIKNELGAEYADLKPEDFTPAKLAQKFLEVEGLKQELEETKNQLTQIQIDIKTAVADDLKNLETGDNDFKETTEK